MARRSTDGRGCGCAEGMRVIVLSGLCTTLTWNKPEGVPQVIPLSFNFVQQNTDGSAAPHKGCNLLSPSTQRNAVHVSSDALAAAQGTITSLLRS